MFIDELTITIRSGNGGKGCESLFRRPDRKVIPNGGDGGDGGDVIIRADSNVGSLLSLKSKRVFEAEHGGAGLSNNKYGRKGNDCIISVPCGTTVFNKDDQLLIRDMIESGDQVLVLKGGHRGYGNHQDRDATLGEAGKEIDVFLSYKIITDIVLIGLPNSGKTAFLKTLTGAGVHETDYPFSTKAPQLGTYRTDTSQLRICDLPSIYHGSEEEHGLGTHFLKHLERARLFFFVVDVGSKFSADLSDGFQMLLNIVQRYNLDFLKKQRVVIVNKADLLEKEEMVRHKLFPGSEKIFFISVKDKTGLDELMNEAAKHLEETL
ncbi:MAG: hypothetical protein A3G33_11545 [Omnitrophica bacterium RIFCSPLOWO2_12_FULL_44_17]|uniref:Obg family GTPase CgtA n=1 Tax=Candidatus Danuiimicrobium aquiferis TaxID=1801832 RepID=A0A1G1KRS7_9BACT|nr:MAG: hypothetical protein A3B72_09385 [Omnitrophica bacterium RIFCSPHIGHO2_02_FULL_45_28]OGW91222.1 MAG: hypothetical protein A3E74_02915 [Omnitrophica bacterium RIFCSPHIGHO2_12_FULL_44_12]OGW95623.1 MAG: hypothetical protein A3G33_11545 [Omnitrophica bacterium RIFCSPLOWO2_12_FULL_44_17]OGX03664.1 MAG: hypothetical protein A3J12_00950 [Omnitrophica bacterium RIFCSPLOWO2_02_FULL_44_11]